MGLHDSYRNIRRLRRLREQRRGEGEGVWIMVANWVEMIVPRDSKQIVN